MEHLTTEDLAKRLHMSPGTLRNWRIKNLGPRYIKSGKKVLYPAQEVETWEKANTKGPN